MKYPNIREEELKNKVGQDFFTNFDTTKIVGNIDFCVTVQDTKKSQRLYCIFSDVQQQQFDENSLNVVQWMPTIANHLFMTIYSLKIT